MCIRDRHTTFQSNTGAKGGGAFVGSAATIAGTTFHNNKGFDGGGAYVQGDATLTGTNFLSNTAFTGGGVYVSGTVSITDTTFLGNSASSNQGCLLYTSEGLEPRPGCGKRWCRTNGVDHNDRGQFNPTL